MAMEAEVKHFSSRLPRRLSLVVYFFFSVPLACFGDLGSGNPQLAPKEVEALKAIGSQLGKKWDFSVDPCSGGPTWLDLRSDRDAIQNNVTCLCKSKGNYTICHVTAIVLKGQNLTGYLPKEISLLTHLRVLDLSRNYLYGSIPRAWVFLPLKQLSLAGNRVSGTIPEELATNGALMFLALEANRLHGPIPEAIGNLTYLRQLALSANNLSGDLPDSLGNIKNMTDFRIDGNPITGKIPSFIGNWTRLQRLDIQGTSMEGPFPSAFGALGSLVELRVCCLKGGHGEFPPLQNMKGLRELVLRNLSISGQLPDYLGNIAALKTLDLSFNNFTGPIPKSFTSFRNSMNFMFLTHNKLDGEIPSWIFNSQYNLDISYNSFTEPALSYCQQGNVNMVSSFSSTNSNAIASCFMKNHPCFGNATSHNLFINCGGDTVTVDGIEYEGDTSQLGASRYAESRSRNWAYSSTGNFIGNDYAKYIAHNASKLNMKDPELYMTARLSPLYLKYYGLCLQKGSYTVQLHFAEIMFTDDQTYKSVGERLFDVSIQGQKVLVDFNIAKEANGTGKKIIKSFETFVDSTLEIHLEWAGKGTNLIPEKGVYGPLISAISVTPNFTPDTGGSNLSVGAIMGIVAASSVVILLIVALLWFCLRRKNTENTTDRELRGLELQTNYFTLKQIKTATRNFDPENKIGEGGFGPVYKGVLPDGSVIAVKQLSSKSKQGNREFINEIGMISALQHPNLVKLHGCCIDGNQLLLIYEYMENNSLAGALFGPNRCRLQLDWQTRHKICLGIARGLAFLHEESRLKIVHRDIKATNILLDKDLNAKISDFGLARLDDEEHTHISTRVAGTIGYMAPEYALRGYLTDKADVYSFGVVILEVVTGMSNSNYRPKEDFVYLLDWVYVLHERGRLLELVDPNLDSNYEEEVLEVLNVALLCTNPSPTLRPTMSTVVGMLEGKTPVGVPEVNQSPSMTGDWRFKSLELKSNGNQSKSTTTIENSTSPLDHLESTTYSPTARLLAEHSEEFMVEESQGSECWKLDDGTNYSSNSSFEGSHASNRQPPSQNEETNVYTK